MCWTSLLIYACTAPAALDRVELLSGPLVQGTVSRQTEKVVVVRSEDGFQTTIPLSRIHALTVDSKRRVVNAADRKKDNAPAKIFSFKTYDEKTIRSNPTTQIAIRVLDWPGETFLLWLPETVSDICSPPPTPDKGRDVQPVEGGPFVWRKLWAQWFPEVAHQDFAPTEDGGLLWRFTRSENVQIDAQLMPRPRALTLEVRVKNIGRKELRDVAAQNCLHLSAAPGFACQDCSRIYFRTEGQWRALAEVGTTDGLPMFYRPGFLESGRYDSWGGHFKNHRQPQRADHPLMICVSKDGRRAIGTASDDYQCVFHNRGISYLLCIHSQQAPVPKLPPGKEAVFRQMIYFVDGGVKETLEACTADLKGISRPGTRPGKVLRPPAFFRLLLVNNTLVQVNPSGRGESRW